MTDRIHAIFSPRDASLIAGILYGDAQFTKADRDLFASAGLLHLVAVSGSNVTIVVGFLLQSFLAIRFSRRRAFIGVSIGLIAFVAFVGFGASVARAAFMGWLALTARFVGRIPSGSRLLLVAAAILCMIDPWQLAFDAGFALSFLAMWGIIRWAPIIEAHLSWLPNILGVRQALSATIAATVWTGPYLAWAFGRFSLAGLFTNLLALPLVPFFMTASGLAAAWGSLPGGAIVALPAAGCSSAVYFIAGLARSVPWLDFSVNMTTGACVATYAALIIFSSRLSAEKGLSTTKTGSTRFAEKNGDACQRAVTVVLQKSSVDSINAK